MNVKGTTVVLMISLALSGVIPVLELVECNELALENSLVSEDNHPLVYYLFYILIFVSGAVDECDGGITGGKI